MSLRGSLLHLLADGHFHSGAWLGEKLDVSRNAIWKHIRFLQGCGIDIYAVRGRGYRLAKPLELLSVEAIRSALSPKTAACLGHVDVLAEVDSTNRYLLQCIGNGAASGDVCLAEYQSAGRGRQGRLWVSPFAQNIYLSMLWRFPGGAEGLAGLGLAVGVSVLRTVRHLGGNNVMLKWPNDLISNDRKLAGILLEMCPDRNGDSNVVIGVGLNVAMSAQDSGQGADATAIDQPWIDIEALLGRPVSRNLVAATLIHYLLVTVETFQAYGLGSFIQEWQQNDYLKGQSVTLTMIDRVVHGIAQGIDDYGALRIEQGGRVNRYFSGDVSVRVQR